MKTREPAAAKIHALAGVLFFLSVSGTMMDAQGVFAQEDSRVDIGSRARRSPAPKISAPIDAQMDTMMMTILRNALVQVQMDQHLLDLGDDDPQARALSVSPAAQGSNFGVGRFRSANKRPQNSLPRAQDSFNEDQFDPQVELQSQPQQDLQRRRRPQQRAKQRTEQVLPEPVSQGPPITDQDLLIRGSSQKFPSAFTSPAASRLSPSGSGRFANPSGFDPNLGQGSSAANRPPPVPVTPRSQRLFQEPPATSAVPEPIPATTPTPASIIGRQQRPFPVKQRLFKPQQQQQQQQLRVQQQEFQQQQLPIQKQEFQQQLPIQQQEFQPQLPIQQQEFQPQQPIQQQEFQQQLLLQQQEFQQQKQQQQPQQPKPQPRQQPQQTRVLEANFEDLATREFSEARRLRTGKALQFSGGPHRFEAMFHQPGGISLTGFSCSNQRFPGLYADVEANCEVFHMCHSNGLRSSFMCPPGTAFDQDLLVCNWIQAVGCRSDSS